MAEITAQLVKELRDKTGAGMMDCKKALNETSGDMDAAVDWLRAKGITRAAAKADRVAAEGLIGVALDGKSGAVVEVNSETDFVARNEIFQAAVKEIATLALTAKGDAAKLAEAKTSSGKTVTENLKELVGKIGENMSFRRSAAVSVSKGVVASYVHNSISSDLGRIGVLVAIESEADKDTLDALGKQVCMHVAATSPLALTAEDIDPVVVEREKTVFTEQAKESGKPDAVIEKMVQGRLNKFFKEQVLLKQQFVIDPDKTVEQAVEEAAKSAGKPIKVTGFVRYALGEGIEKGECDFAAEVAAAAGTK
ncbi:MAG: translation elongation factor Ts [Alphaproteobacteria bacterium]